MTSEKKADPSDVLSLGPTLPNGDVTFVRARQTETGTLIEGGTATIHPGDKIPEGEGEHLRLKHLVDNNFEVVETLRSGPSKVNSAAFRSNWETIFGAKQTVGQA